MERILRARTGWQDAIADALAAVPRPIPLDERLLARTRSGDTVRGAMDRSRMPPARPAATLLAIYPDDDGRLLVPLTVRRAELRAHAGEVSLPGGRVDPDDATHEAAALREAHEEVGIEPAEVRLVGSLEEVWIPVSNFALRPFVGTLERRPRLTPHDAEVAAIVELPLERLLGPDAVREEAIEVRGLTLHAGVYRHADLRVWGATALTLGMLAHVLEWAADGEGGG